MFNNMFIECNRCNGTGYRDNEPCCDDGGNYYCDVCDERMDGSESQLEHCSKDDEHICIWCGQTVNKGQTYIIEKSVYDGEMQDHKWHPECKLESYKQIWEDGIEDFIPYENERGKADD